MKIVDSLENFTPDIRRAPTAVAIGTFDGVHRAHQRILRTAVDCARKQGGRSIALTFFPHPLTVTRPDRPPALLTSLEHRIRLIKEVGVDICLVVNFAHDFSRMSPQSFCRDILHKRLAAGWVVVGESFRFGKAKSGSVELLRIMGDRFGFMVKTLKPVRCSGTVISSTHIREYVEKGDLRAAARMLGRSFTVLGTVEHGDRRGRRLGYPTANIDPHQEAIPPNGVYAAKIRVGTRLLPAMLSIGTRPTFEPQRRLAVIEVHIFDFSRRIYGQTVEIEFIRYVRPERRYLRTDALLQQMQRDEKNVRRILTNA